MKNNKYRYPGTRPFETDEKELFFGRSNDSENLYQQIFNEKTVLLYGKSGLGKSSLINAGLLPLLQQEHNFEIIQVRFGNYNAQLAEYETPLNKVIAAISQTGTHHSPLTADNSQLTYLDKIIPNENSLWYRLKQHQHPDKEHTLLFIFDQFEELLTYPEEDVFNFKKQFATLLFSNIPSNIRTALEAKMETDRGLLTKEERTLLNTPLRTKTLFSIRSDRMSDLNRIADYFPNILKTFFELKPLTRQQAKEAIEKPAQQATGTFASPPFSFTPQVVNKMIAALEDKQAHTLESFQLQMVCRYAEDLIVQHKTIRDGEIDEQDLGEIQSIFAENYRRVLAELPEAFHHKVQVLIEERLIVGGNRVPLPELVILQQEKISQEVVDKLLDSHILRAERNSTGGRSIELSHDTLIAPVTEAFKKRTATEQEQAEKQKAAAEAARRQQELDAANFIANEERERARVQAGLRQDAERAKDRAKKNLRIVRLVAFVAVILAVGAIVAVLFAMASKKEAVEAKNFSDELFVTVNMQGAISYAIEKKGFGESYETTEQWKEANANFKEALDSLKRCERFHPQTKENKNSKEFSRLYLELETKLAGKPQ